MARPEKTIEDYLVARVKFLGGDAPKLDTRGHAGRCDRIVTFPNMYDRRGGKGYIFYVELKAPGKSARPLQRHEHRRLRALGLTVVVLDTIEAINDFLADFGTH